MKINISEIKASQKPIRTEQDEDKLNELAQSIKEQGLIVPIKVRPDNGGYEVVYGHRRLEACKRVGFDEIESIIEGVDDTNALTQSLIENVVREDMSDYEIGIALKKEKETRGETNEQVGKRYGFSDDLVRRYLKFASNLGAKDFKHVTKGHLAEASVGGVSDNDFTNILEKADKENLTERQTRKVAKAVVQAKTPEAKEALLETPIENPIFDRIVRAKARAKRDINEQVRDKHFEKTQEVKEFLDSIFTFEKAIKGADEAIDFGKFSPEAVQFTINRLDKLSESISELVIRLMEK